MSDHRIAVGILARNPSVEAVTIDGIRYGHINLPGGTPPCAQPAGATPPGVGGRPGCFESIVSLGIRDEDAAQLARVLAKATTPLRRFEYALAVLGGKLTPHGVVEWLRELNYWPGARA